MQVLTYVLLQYRDRPLSELGATLGVHPEVNSNNRLIGITPKGRLSSSDLVNMLKQLRKSSSGKNPGTICDILLLSRFAEILKGVVYMSLAQPKKTFGIVQIKKRHVITLGQEVRKELNLNEGDILDVSVEEGKIVLEPKKLIPADQQWFWTEEWQKGEREAQAEIDAGLTKRAGSAEEFLKELMKDD